MRVRLLGTRGSLYSPRPGLSRYGGNTACVEVQAQPGSLVVLDAGTGIRQVADPGPDLERVDVLLTHLHMDHIVGLGFFWALFRPGLDVHLWGPPSTTTKLRARLARYLSPPLFPVRLRDLPCRLHLHDAPRRNFSVPGIRVTSDLVCHPGTTLGYRLEGDGGVLAYLPDHEPTLGVRDFPGDPRWTSGFDLLAGANVAIHDAQYTEEEYAAKVGWGHSSIGQAIAMAELASVEHLVLFHHDPDHDDRFLDQLDVSVQAERPSGLRVWLAVENDTFELGKSVALTGGRGRRVSARA